jgi:hypothetical protein
MKKAYPEEWIGICGKWHHAYATTECKDCK